MIVVLFVRIETIKIQFIRITKWPSCLSTCQLGNVACGIYDGVIMDKLG